MKSTRRMITVCAAAALLWAAGCSGRKGPQAEEPPSAQRLPEDPGAEPAPEPDAVPGEEAPLPKAPAWRELVDRARQEARQGARLYRRGRSEQGRRAYQRALESLRKGPFDFARHPQVERAYYDLLEQLQRLELSSRSANPDFSFLDEQMLPDEVTPLDEASDLNLFAIEVDPGLRDLVHEELLEARFDLPVVLNDEVLKALKFHQKRGRKSVMRGLRRIGRFRALFEQAFEVEGLPKDLIFMSYVESLFNPRAYSRAHARGLWQFTAAAGRDYGLRIDWWIDERSDVEKSTRSAARYLSELYGMFGDWYLALAAYNGGPGRVQRILRRQGNLDFWEMARRRLLPRETRNFVPLVLAAIIIFNDPGRFGFEPVEPEPARAVDKVPVPHQVSLAKVAPMVGLSESELAALNPELRRGVTPYDMKEYRLKVPAGRAQGLEAKLAALPPEERLQFIRHRVRKGETLGHIATRYSTSVRAIAQLNRIRNVHRIRQGQDLMIPVQPPSRAAARRTPSSSGKHVVTRGETLFRIARMYRVELDDLLRWNGLDRSATIYPGQEIRVSADSGNED